MNMLLGLALLLRLPLGSTPAASVSRYVPSAPPLSVAAFGAVANGDTLGLTGTDNTAAFQRAADSAVAAQRTLFIPAGVWRVDRQVTLRGPVAIRLASGAVVWRPTVAPGCLFYSAHTFALAGGYLRGGWQPAGQGTPAITKTRVLDNRLVWVNAEQTPIDSVVITNVRFRRAAGNAVQVAQGGQRVNRIGAIRLAGLTIDECYQGVLINNIGSSVRLTNVSITNCRITNTANTGGFFNDAYAAGDGVVVWGLTDGFRFIGNVVRDVGRMGLECYPGDAGFVAAGHQSTGTVIADNEISRAGYFNVSVSSHDAQVRDNLLIASHPNYVEGFGNRLQILNNRLQGVAINNTDEPALDTLNKRGLVIEGNTLYDMPGQRIMIEAHYAHQVRIRHNKLVLRYSHKGTGERLPISTQGSTNVQIEDNEMHAQPPYNSGFYNLSGNTDLRWRNDQIELIGYHDGDLDYLLFIAGLRDARIDNIRFASDNAFQTTTDLLQGLNYPPQKLWKRQFDGRQWTITPLARSQALPAPPDSAAVGATYLVGEDATGPWAAHTGQFATWTGRGWTFTPFSGAYNYTDKAPDRNNMVLFNGMPQSAPNGSANLLFNGTVLSNVTITNCDFTAAGKISRQGKAMPTLSNAYLDAVSVEQTPYRLDAPRLLRH